MNDKFVPGFYGKLLCRGDFITRGLSKNFVQPWDTWLQQSLVSSRERLSETWVDIYLVSPIWHFMLSANICGGSSWMGLMMPSVDKVGRYFPFTLAVNLPSQMMVSHLADDAITNWFIQADNLALSTLDKRFDLTKFEQQVTQLEIPYNTVPTHAVAQPRSKKTTWYMPFSNHEEFATLCQSVAQNDAYASYSLWWTSEYTDDFQRTFIYGNWQQWGWQHV